MGWMHLTDGRVTLRAPTADDGPEVVAAVQASLGELSPWMVWAEPGYGVSDHVDWVVSSAQRGERPLLICAPGGEIVGATGLNQIDGLNRRANLGYWLRSDRTGRGYATRAVVLTARFAVEELGFRRIDIMMSVENERSRAVAERVGAYHEGVLRSALELRGRRHDAHLYSLLSAEVRAWPRVRGHR